MPRDSLSYRKPNGSVRPIAVGDLIYPVCARALLRHKFRDDLLLPGQFGVYTKGGVEPIIRAVHIATYGELAEPTKPTHLALLDFKNAFNTIDRNAVAAGIRMYAPHLYRAAKWAYGQPSTVIALDNTSNPHYIDSRQGVRQGDPFGPSFFSLGLRATLAELERDLGPGHTILAYLDDIVILGPNANTLAKAILFFDRHTTPLELNKQKCSIHALRDNPRIGSRDTRIYGWPLQRQSTIPHRPY